MAKSLNAENRKKFFDTQPNVCALCGQGPRDEEVGLTPDDDRYDEWTVEHIIPRAEGGSNHFDNLAKAHRSCNELRGAMLLVISLQARRCEMGYPDILDERSYRIARLATIVNAGGDVNHLYRRDRLEELRVA